MDPRKKRPLAVFVGGWLVLAVPAMLFAQPFGVLGKGVKGGSGQRVLSAVGGRFVFGQISDSTKDKFMLDTRTGRLWRIAESGAIGIYLKPVPYHDEKGAGPVLPSPVRRGYPAKKGPGK